MEAKGDRCSWTEGISAPTRWRLPTATHRLPRAGATCPRATLRYPERPRRRVFRDGAPGRCPC